MGSGLCLTFCQYFTTVLITNVSIDKHVDTVIDIFQMSSFHVKVIL